MDILLTILIATLVLGFLVFIHEGGHFLAARRVRGARERVHDRSSRSQHRRYLEGHAFWRYCCAIGGYAAVCGMGTGTPSPHLKAVLGYMYAHGTADMEDVADALGITDDEAYQALEELTEWGSLKRPTRKDKLNTYRTPACLVSGVKYAEGTPREVANLNEFFASEQKQQYCMLPFWKRITILLAGPFMNLLYA